MHDVVGHHVAQRAGVIEIAAASFDADGFGHRDLHVIDVAAVPDRLENSVGETERHDVLDGLFAQIVIDAVDLLFVDFFEQLLVQRLGRFQIVPERLFDDHAPPVVVALLHQSGGREFLHDRTEETGRGGEVVEEILMGRVLLIHLGEKVFELRVEFVVAEIAGEVVKAA